MWQIPRSTKRISGYEIVVNSLSHRSLYYLFHIAMLCMGQIIQEVRTTDNSRPLRPRSRSFKVINFCCNRKPIYDFLLVINCHLSSISHRFRDIASRSRKPLHPTSSPQIEGPPSNFVTKLGRQEVKALGYILVKTT